MLPDNSLIKLYEQSTANLYFFHNTITDKHSHPCLQLTISLHDILITLETDDENHHGFGFIIRSNIPHKLNTNKTCVLNFLVEPEAPFFNLLSDFTKVNPVYLITKKQSLILAQYFIHSVKNKCLFDIQHIANLLHGSKTDCRYQQDNRIVKATSIISTLPIKLISSKELAAKVNLSESHFLHIFRAKLGINFRGYLLWKRLRDATNSLESKSNLTTLANDKGFADVAHFSRTCLSSFGLRPSELKRALMPEDKSNEITSIDCFNNDHLQEEFKIILISG